MLAIIHVFFCFLFFCFLLLFFGTETGLLQKASSEMRGVCVGGGGDSESLRDG